MVPMDRACPVVATVREELDAICTSEESDQPQPPPLHDSFAKFRHVRAYVRYLTMWEVDEAFISPGSPIANAGPASTAR